MSVALIMPAIGYNNMQRETSLSATNGIVGNEFETIELAGEVGGACRGAFLFFAPEWQKDRNLKKMPATGPSARCKMNEEGTRKAEGWGRKDERGCRARREECRAKIKEFWSP